MITRRFSFAARLQGPVRGWDWAAWLNLALLAVFLLLFGGRLVFVPGWEVPLPVNRAADPLPLGDSVVLTLKGPDLVFFEGKKLALRELRPALADWVRTGGGRRLLVLMDRNLPLEVFTQVTEIARAAGVEQIQVPVAEPTAP